MQKVVAAHSSGTQEQIQEIQRELQASKDELEGSRAKRMAARTEMISLSQV
jgi:membrane protein insertase Oxa1/YidC/SpoIIIJ